MKTAARDNRYAAITNEGTSDCAKRINREAVETARIAVNNAIEITKGRGSFEREKSKFDKAYKEIYNGGDGIFIQFCRICLHNNPQ